MKSQASSWRQNQFERRNYAVNTEAETATQEVADAKLDLTVDVKETSACERHVTVIVPRSDIERYFAKQLSLIHI